MSINKILFLCLSFIFSIAFATTPIKKSVVNIQHWTAKNGARVYFVAAKQLPMVDVVLAIDAGSDRDALQPGLASLTANMIGQGTQQLSADNIATGFDQLGAIFNTTTDRDMTLISLRSLTKAEVLQPALKLFTTVISEANFPELAFKRRQRNTIQAIEQKQQQPSEVANAAFFKALYGSYPYGHPVLGNKQSVAKLTIKDSQQFYKQYYVAKNTVIAIVGDLDKAQAIKIANQITSKLSAGKPAPKLKTAPSPTTKTIAIPFPATQNYIRVGTLGINRHDPDYFPLLVGNYTLGGGMVSRLFESVREKRGLSYGIGSAFVPLAYKGPFIIVLQTRNSKGKQALHLTKEVLNNFVKDGPTPQELTAAKNYLMGSFPLRIDSNSDIASYLVTIGFYHLPLNYLDTFNQKVAAVTTAQIKKAFQKHINSQHMVTVVVGGDAEKIKA